MYDDAEEQEKRDERQRQEAEEKKASAARVSAQLHTWLHHQSARLGLSCAEILAAVKRGWTGDVIADIPAAESHVLASRPPLDGEMAAAIGRIRAAPILPVPSRQWRR